jgi:hypothetical protein
VYGRHFLQRKRYGGNFGNEEKLDNICIEVLVNEIPVDGKDVSILSDSELCFILPPTSKAGVFTIVLRLIDQDYVSETINPTSLVSTESPKVISPPGILSVRSDLYGSGNGWIYVRDKRIRDIQLYFAPISRSAHDREKEKERNKDKDMSFFIPDNDQIEDVWDDDEKRNTKNNKKRGRVDDDSDASSDSDAFMEKPPVSFSRRGRANKRVHAEEQGARLGIAERKGDEGGRMEAGGKREGGKRLRGGRSQLEIVRKESRPRRTFDDSDDDDVFENEGIYIYKFTNLCIHVYIYIKCLYMYKYMNTYTYIFNTCI